MEPQNQQTKKDSTKKILVALILILSVAIGTVVFFWNSQVKELKQDRNLDAQRIQELENKLKDLERIDSPKTDPATPTDQDVTEINETVESFCEGNGGYNGIKITKDYLTTEKEGNTPYYNGYAIIAVGCKNDGGGYQSYMQRQSDNSYKQLFGAQDVPGCDKVDQYKIPKQILSMCEVPTTGNEPADFRENTN